MPVARIAQREGPPAAVGGRPEHGVVLGESGRYGGEQLRGDLWRVHADQQRTGAGSGGVDESARESGAEAGAALRYPVPAEGRLDLSTVDDGVPDGGCRAGGGEGVGQCGGGDLCGLLGGARWAQPGLDLSGYRGLGDDEQLHVHRASTRLMSATVRAVPSTVPVTFDRPPSVRGA